MLTSFASITAATKCNPGIKLSWGPSKPSTAKKFKTGSVHTQGGLSLYQIGELFGNAYTPTATG